MSDFDLDDFDFAAALSAPRRMGQTLKGRRELDRKKLGESDRRKIQTTGRTEQMNLKVRPMMKLEFVQRADGLGLMPTELFEKAWEHYKQTVLEARPAAKKRGL